MGAILHIRLLGGLSLNHGDEAVTTVNTPRLHSLLAYLLVHRDRPQLRQHVAFVFWPDSSEAQARNNLRQILHELRHGLPDADRLLAIDARTVGWRADADFELDVAEFEAAIADAAAARREAEERAALERAARCYRGDLLPGCYDAWIVGERERLRQVHRRALARLAALLETQREYAEAIRHLQRLLQEEPTDEESCRGLMRLMAVMGDRAGALRVYRDHAATLRRELGIEPSGDTRRAHQVLLRNEAATDELAPASADARADVGPPLVGRDREWQALLAAWRGAAAGKPGFALLTGEAGIGKSRLSEELMGWARSQGASVAATRSYATEGQLSLAPVSDWLRTDVLRRGLLRLAPMWLTEVARILPELRTERPELPPPAAITEYGQRQRFFEALARSVLAAPQPLLLVIDDLQWCDRETIEWLHFLLRFDAHARMLALGTVRDEGLTAQHPLRGMLLHLHGSNIPVTEIALEPLDAAETARLAAHVARQELDDGAALRLYRDTQGNPLFVVEMARARLAGPGSFEAPEPRPGQAGPQLPAKVQAVIESRLAQLSPAARELAHVAAAIGRGFSLDLLLEASQADEDGVVAPLDELWQRRIVRELGAANHYDFTHDKLREVAYAEIGAPQRRFLHRRIARALEKLHARAIDPVSGSVAAHYERAGLDVQAADHYQRAAAVAQRTYANEDAVELLLRSLSLIERTPPDLARDTQELRIQLALCPLFRMTKGWTSPEVERSLDRAMALCDKVGDDVQRAQVLYGMQSLHVVQAKLERVQLLSDELRVLYQRTRGTAPPPETEMMLAGSSLHLGRVTQASARFEHAISTTDPSQVQRIVEEQGWNFAVHGRAWHAHALWLMGRPDAALARALEAVQIARDLGQPFNQSVAATYLATLQQLRGDLATAHASAEASLTVTTESRTPYYRAWSMILVRHAQACAEPDEQTISALRQAIAEFESTGARPRLPYYYSLLADVCGRAGRVAEGLAAIDQATAHARATNERLWDAELHRLRGTLRLAGGASVEEVEAAYARALEIARAIGERSFELRAATALARLRRRRRPLEEVLSAFSEGHDTPDLRAAHALLAELTPH